MKVVKAIFLSCLFILFGTLTSNAQIVKFIKNAVQAKYRVYITQQPKEASHWIYRVASPADLRNPGDWYIVTNPVLFKNAMTLYEVKQKSEADFVVYYVSSKDSARIIQ